MTSTLRGALWMSGAVFSFCAMAIAARQLLDHIGVFEILFFRTGVALLIVLAVAASTGIVTLRTRRIGVHLWRNLFHLGGQASWVFALGALPLATVFAIEFTAPIWIALLATLMLGERLNRGRALMLVLGFAGVLVILRPGFAIVQTAALPDWTMPLAGDWPWIAAIGTGSFTAHYCLTRAMSLADATVVVPVDFFRLPLIAVVGALFYGEPFDPAVILGAAMIFAGVWYSLAYEKRMAVIPKTRL